MTVTIKQLVNAHHQNNNCVRAMSTGSYERCSYEYLKMSEIYSKYKHDISNGFVAKEDEDNYNTLAQTAGLYTVATAQSTCKFKF